MLVLRTNSGKEDNSQSDARPARGTGGKRRDLMGAGNADREALCRRDHHDHDHHSHRICLADRYRSLPEVTT